MEVWPTLRFGPHYFQKQNLVCIGYEGEWQHSSFERDGENSLPPTRNETPIIQPVDSNIAHSAMKNSTKGTCYTERTKLLWDVKTS
jgi:hypothetical protein